MAIRIKSSREGFWRCGRQHGKTPKIWPNDAFSAAELERLKADTMLTVDIVNDAELDATAPAGAPEPPKAGGQLNASEELAAMTVAQLKAEAAKYGLTLDKKAKKADYEAAILAAWLSPAEPDPPAAPATSADDTGDAADNPADPADGTGDTANGTGEPGENTTVTE